MKNYTEQHGVNRVIQMDEETFISFMTGFMTHLTKSDAVPFAEAAWNGLVTLSTEIVEES